MKEEGIPEGEGQLQPGKIQTSHLVQIHQYPFILSSGKCPISSHITSLSSCQCFSDLLLWISELKHLSEVPDKGENEGGNTTLDSNSKCEQWCLPFWAAAKLLDCLAASLKMCHLSTEDGSCGLYVDFSFCNL